MDLKRIIRLASKFEKLANDHVKIMQMAVDFCDANKEDARQLASYGNLDSELFKRDLQILSEKISDHLEIDFETVFETIFERFEMIRSMFKADDFKSYEGYDFGMDPVEFNNLPDSLLLI
jgi:hypothetical protein